MHKEVDGSGRDGRDDDAEMVMFLAPFSLYIIYVFAL